MKIVTNNKFSSQGSLHRPSGLQPVWQGQAPDAGWFSLPRPAGQRGSGLSQAFTPVPSPSAHRFPMR